MTNAYMQEGLDAFKSGQVAMQMNWFAFFPGLYKDPNVGGDKIGFFVNPAGPKGQFTQLGGQGISVVSYSDHRDDALSYIKWFAQPAVQQKWWQLGGYSALKAVVRGSRLPHERALRPEFLDSMGIVKDFWAEPSYAQLLLDMQKRVHDYVVADKGTAKEALDLGQGLDQGLQGARQDGRVQVAHRFQLDRCPRKRAPRCSPPGRPRQPGRIGHDGSQASR